MPAALARNCDPATMGAVRRPLLQRLPISVSRPTCCPETVDWPNAWEGGRVHGREGVRSYWTRQWAEFDPHVEPIEVTEREASRIDVKVHQLVRDLKGDVLSDQIVLHVFSITNGLITRMDIHESKPAFRHAPVE